MKKYYGEIKMDDCVNEFEFEMPEDATDEEIEEAAKQEAFEFIEWFYKPVK